MSSLLRVKVLLLGLSLLIGLECAISLVDLFGEPSLPSPGAASRRSLPSWCWLWWGWRWREAVLVLRLRAKTATVTAALAAASVRTAAATVAILVGATAAADAAADAGARATRVQPVVSVQRSGQPNAGQAATLQMGSRSCAWGPGSVAWNAVLRWRTCRKVSFSSRAASEARTPPRTVGV